jgi:hypothetical protein
MISRCSWFWICLLAIGHGFVARVVADDLVGEPSFNRDIRPLLSDACFSCHGPDAAHREAGLRLDEESSAKESAIIPGDSRGSEMMLRITSDDPALRMPPPESGKALKPEDVERLAHWIDRGARYEPFWAYQRPIRHKIPMAGTSWPEDPIDDFLAAKQQQHGLAPSSDTDRRTLIRRITLDLTGLPPTEQDIEAFVQDTHPAAYRRVVDRLLASPTYGERMAMYWLDLVRYADTVGYHGDQDHNISPYRDYVIDALNDDLSLDQFTREQLAGDLLPEPTIQRQVASGYNRLLQTSHEGGVQPKEYMAIYGADRIRNLSLVWMGATVGCAQCHDHKYDPYTSKDFYSLVAFFADIDEQQHFKVGSNTLPTRRPPEISVLSRWQQQRVDAIEARIAELDRFDSSGDAILQEARKQERASLAEERTSIENQARLTMVSQSIEPREIRILPRGNWMDDSGQLVTPAIPEFLGAIPTSLQRLNRLDLANWLVDTETGYGGQTARVFVNRYWYLLYGGGLSPSLDDFGGQGLPPVHPELLDHLSISFVEQGWHVKRLLRRLAFSHSYRQTSNTSPSSLQADPTNQFFARQSRYRLPAESVRDVALSVSGVLVSGVGGASVKPHQPDGYYRHLNFPKRLYVPDRGSNQYRRGVYVHWQRQFLHPALKAMDAPSREECTAQRPRSNTPLESLALLNDPTVIDAAIGFAARILKAPQSTDAERLQFAFRVATGREPDVYEQQMLMQLLQRHRVSYQENPAEAEALIASCDKHLVPADIGVVELAAWTAVTRTLLNLYETLTRN